MCSNPQRKYDSDGFVEFACRNCDQCLATRMNDWVSRCVAEAAIAGETLAVRLSYRNNVDTTQPDGAITFRYADVQVFFKRLRQAYQRHYDAHGEIRYIVCGERGSKHDRVHYHVIIFSDRPISVLGEFSDWDFKPLRGIVIDRRPGIHWSFWDHGHILFQEPDQGGMAYALKYALSDQWNSVKSKGTGREDRALVSSAALFRPSKKPPIGFRWLEWRCNDWAEREVVPTSLNLKPAGLHGFWYPKGALREYVLHRIWEINRQYRRDYGCDAPTWSTLLSSLESQTTEQEYLLYGPQEHIEEQDYESRGELIRQNCGGAFPCADCREQADEDDLRKEEFRLIRAWVKSPYWEGDFSEYVRQRRTCNPFCQRRCTEEVRAAFAR